jgi:hypothetical protein
MCLANSVVEPAPLPPTHLATVATNFRQVEGHGVGLKATITFSRVSGVPNAGPHARLGLMENVYHRPNQVAVKSGRREVKKGLRRDKYRMGRGFTEIGDTKFATPEARFQSEGVKSETGG